MADTPMTIRASIDPGALEKTTRFFNAGLDDILTELFQNARRAGATTVTVSIDPETITIHDNGTGISDPSRLLAFGGSGWDAETCALEDPAGMGLFSLSRRGCRISSRTEASEGWTTALTPEVFQGKAEAELRPDAGAERGTTIVFPASVSADGQVEGAIQAAARHYPVPVVCRVRTSSEPDRFEPVEIMQEDFLKKAVYIKSVPGGRIGVVANNDIRPRYLPTVNFHGALLAPETPHISQKLGGSTFQAIFDLTGGAGLELVLPARKEVVQNAAWEDFQRLGRIAIFEYIATLATHRLSQTDWQAARDLGIILSEAEPVLFPYVPDTLDVDYGSGRAAEPVDASSNLITFADEPVGHQCLRRAMEVAGRSNRLFNPCAAYAGYAWYDRLARLSKVRWLVEKDGSEVEFANLVDIIVAIDGVETDKAPVSGIGNYLKPDHIRAELHYTLPDGSVIYDTLETDCLLFGDVSYLSYPDELTIFVTSDPGKAEPLTVDRIADLICKSWFCPSEDAEADSYETQRRHYEIAALTKAMETLQGEDAALAVLIESHVLEHVIWTCPRDRKVHIEIGNSKVTVFVDPPQPDESARDMNTDNPSGSSEPDSD